MEEYIELHNCLQDLFDLYFESESHVYWEIFYKYMSEKNLSYAKLGVLYHYSTTKIRNIVHLVKDFFGNEVIPEGRVVNASLGQLLNAYCPIEVIPEGRVVNDSW